MNQSFLPNQTSSLPNKRSTFPNFPICALILKTNKNLYFPNQKSSFQNFRITVSIKKNESCSSVAVEDCWHDAKLTALNFDEQYPRDTGEDACNFHDTRVSRYYVSNDRQLAKEPINNVARSLLWNEPRSDIRYKLWTNFQLD